MVKVKLYGFNASPPLRGSMMSCAALGVEYDLEFIDVTKIEHYGPEYLKLNPIRSIPTMVDGDYVLFYSHAISCYLANKYGKDDKWYPKDPRKRGIVDQRLHFDGSVLGPAFKKYALPILFGKQPNLLAIAEVETATAALDKLLDDKEFVALNHPTLADCHCSATVSSIQAMLPHTLTPRVVAWLQRCKSTLPDYEKINKAAVEMFEAARTMGPSKLAKL